MFSDAETGVGPAAEPQRKGPPRPEKGNQRALKHGAGALKELLRRSIDGRWAVAKAMRARRAEYQRDLGGADQLSTQQLTVIDQAVRLEVIIDSIDAWLFAQQSMINKRSKALLPAVRERAALVTTLQRLLEALGLERRAKPAADLASIAAEYGSEGDPR